LTNTIPYNMHWLQWYIGNCLQHICAHGLARFFFHATFERLGLRFECGSKTTLNIYVPSVATCGFLYG
jgi:hypothetical protein